MSTRPAPHAVAATMVESTTVEPRRLANGLAAGSATPPTERVVAVAMHVAQRLEASPEAVALLRAAGVDEDGLNLLDLYDVARVAPAGDGQSARLVMPLVDAKGDVRALGSWLLADLAAGQVVSSPDHPGLVLACVTGRRMLQTSAPPSWFAPVPPGASPDDERRLVVRLVAGPIAFLRAVASVSDADQHPPAILGLLSTWSDEMAWRVPDSARTKAALPKSSAIAADVHRTLAARRKGTSRPPLTLAPKTTP